MDAMSALAEANLDSLPPDDPALAQLRTEVNTSWLHEHRLNLKAGSRRMTYVCVALSMGLMLVVGSLSVVYNRGVALLAEIETLAASQPDRRFGQLERQLLVAQTELFATPPQGLNATNCLPGENGCDLSPENRTVNELAQESSYVVLHELRDLNFQLSSLQYRTAQFSIDTGAPIPVLNRVTARLGQMFKYGPRQAVAGTAGDPPSAGALQPLAKESWISKACKDGDLPKEPNGPGGEKVRILGMDMENITAQACRFNLSYTSATMPSVRLWATQIKDEIAPFSLWLLPCLYASLGSIIYFMRLILDPAQPNPPTHRIIHRLALAALAGMMIGWFWEPTLGQDAEIRTAGFGLFAFAFVVGFSIDVFFAMLDRLVSLATSAISRIGK